MFTDLVPFVSGAVASMIIGSLWYSPVMFGKQWMRLMGIKKPGKVGASQMMPVLIASFLCTLVMSYVLGSLLLVLNVSSPLLGLQIGFLVWLGFVATTSFVNTLYGNKSLKLYVLDNGYHLVSLIVMGFIYTLFVR